MKNATSDGRMSRGITRSKRAYLPFFLFPIFIAVLVTIGIFPRGGSLEGNAHEFTRERGGRGQS